MVGYLVNAYNHSANPSGIKSTQTLARDWYCYIIRQPSIQPHQWSVRPQIIPGIDFFILGYFGHTRKQYHDVMSNDTPSLDQQTDKTHDKQPTMFSFSKHFQRVEMLCLSERVCVCDYQTIKVLFSHKVSFWTLFFLTCIFGLMQTVRSTLSKEKRIPSLKHTLGHMPHKIHTLFVFLKSS